MTTHRTFRPGRHVIGAGPVISIHYIEPRTYPDWLAQAARECDLDQLELLNQVNDGTPIERATALAILAVKLNEPVPADLVDLDAVRGHIAPLGASVDPLVGLQPENEIENRQQMSDYINTTKGEDQ